MDPDVLPTPTGVYRTPGRAALGERIPPPSLRTLLAPLGRVVTFVALVVLGVAAFDALAPSLLGTSADVRFIPSVDHVEDALALVLPLSLVALLVLIARRVRPSWRGLGARGKIAYVASAIVFQVAVVGAGEAAIFFSRGGLHLFAPSHLTSRWLPDGRTAHVYSRGGLQCGYDVFVSAPLSLTATRAFQVSRASCVEPVPHVRDNPDGTLDLLGPDEKPLEPQASPSFTFGRLGGC